VPRRLAPAIDTAAARQLAHELGRRLPLACLILTDNRSVLLSSKRQTDGRTTVRLHHAFVAAEEGTLAAVAAFTKGARGERRLDALRELRRHMEGWQAERGEAEASRPARPVRLRPRGTVYDLEAIRDAVSAERFGGELRTRITWGRWSALRGRRRTIRLGSYDGRDEVIRIHPALDQPWVPLAMVKSVVHHELLHAALPPRESGGRRCLHGPEFRRRERELPEHAPAEAWLAANVSRLLRSRPPRPGGA
jgi:hypothetical protein